MGGQKTVLVAVRREVSGSSGPTLTATPNPVAQGTPVTFTISPAPPADPPEGASPKKDRTYGTPPLGFTWQISFANNTNSIEQSAITRDPNDPAYWTWDTSQGPAVVGTYIATVAMKSSDEKPVIQTANAVVTVTAQPSPPLAAGDTVTVTMRRAVEAPSPDEALWVAIRYSANQLLFQNYVQFVDTIMCPQLPQAGGTAPTIDNVIQSYVKNPPCLPPLDRRRFLPFPNTDAYRVLKIATECFLMLNCGVYLNPATLSALVNGQLTVTTPPTPGQPFPAQPWDQYDDANRTNQSASNLPGDIVSWWTSYLASGNQYLTSNDLNQGYGGKIIPYLALVRSRLSDLPLTPFCNMGIECYGILQRKLTNPCLIELIWSYWHEEAMLVQTLNAISRRFQNFRGPVQHDPLMRFDIDPLRMLNSLLWGYIQDEQHRLTVRRRAYEYNHEYGLTLEGKAVRGLRPSDGRSKFLEAFHNLLYLCTIFFKEDDDTTVVADGFPVLNALREVHYILAAGAHNQFGELPSTARQEMLMQQWLLARPEMREFLGGKIMVPYPEEWMDRVDNVKGMVGWTDVSVVHFHDLAVYGEQIVLSVRYGAWSLPTATAAQAANWARYWRNEIQGYVHAYRAATGIDLTTEPVNSTLPSVLLLKRLATQLSIAR